MDTLNVGKQVERRWFEWLKRRVVQVPRCCGKPWWST